jgi:hypothetical protein
MPRRLKTYQTSIGFFDLAIAAPSMKAAAEAWGSDTDVFKKGFAKESGWQLGDVAAIRLGGKSGAELKSSVPRPT